MSYFEKSVRWKLKKLELLKHFNSLLSILLRFHFIFLFVVALYLCNFNFFFMYFHALISFFFMYFHALISFQPRTNNKNLASHKDVEIIQVFNIGFFQVTLLTPLLVTFTFFSKFLLMKTNCLHLFHFYFNAHPPPFNFFDQHWL